MRKEGKLKFIQPGESVTYEVTVRIKTTSAGATLAEVVLYGSMSIVGVEQKKNNFRIVSKLVLRHDGYVLQNQILFLDLERIHSLQ